MKRPALPPYVTAFKDRHGKTRYRFRRKGCRAVYLPGEPWSRAFMDAYQTALDSAAPAKPIGARKVIPKSFNAVAVAFYESSHFKTKSKAWQTTLRLVIERFRKTIGDHPISAMQRADVVDMMDRLSHIPAGANQRLKVLRALMTFAVERGLIPASRNPVAGVKKLQKHTTGFRTWTDAEIEQYEAAHAPGTTARRALALLLYTAQRRSDVILMGRQHIKDGRLVLWQQKTGEMLSLPILGPLADELDLVPKTQMTFLQTIYGKPFTAAGFGMRMQGWVKAAGLSGLSAHGLRKAAATRLANAGHSQKEIGAWTGHREDSRELRKYTQAADQVRLSDQGADTLAGSKRKRGGV